MPGIALLIPFLPVAMVIILKIPICFAFLVSAFLALLACGRLTSFTETARVITKNFNDGVIAVSYTHLEDAWIYREIKSKSRNMVVIMEGKVFDKIGLIKVDDICGGDYVVTDSSIPEDYKRCFYKNGIRLHQKFDL